MSDRTEALLSELVELQRRQIANSEKMVAGQQEALAGQKLAIERQQVALSRQRIGLRLVFGLIAVMLAMILVPFLYSWYRYLGR
jgi:hypothetical protein